MNRHTRVTGSLFGLAFGDALGAPTEFMSVEDILARWPPDGPDDLQGSPARVTDDTQMALAVGEALAACLSKGSFAPREVERELRGAFVEWLRSPDNNRAPGMTCLRACERLAAGEPWREATVAGSKGCGANMRVTPVGLLGATPGVDDDAAAGLAQFQAALTHGHPTALAASDLTARAVKELSAGEGPRRLAERLTEYARSQRGVYREEWLGGLWQRAGVETPQAFIARGWDECLDVLRRLGEALKSPDYESDPCLATGAGWVAEEALATGLLCFLLYPDSPRRVLQRAAVTSGDSDSIACLAGAFAGAHLGAEGWPAHWFEGIEYASRLEALSNTFGGSEG